MRSHLKIYIYLFLLCPLIVQAQDLDLLLIEAAKNNPSLQAKYTEFEISMQRIAQVHALPDPTLSIGYFVSPVETRVGPQQAKLSLTQMFPWFGTLAAQESIATRQAEAKYKEFIESKNMLYYQVKEAWYPLYELNNILLLQKKNLAIVKTFESLSTVSFKSGKSSMVDVIRAEVMIEDIKTEIKILENKEKPLLTRFNNLLNRSDTISLIIPSMLATQKFQTNYRKDSLFTKNPTLEAFDLQIEAAKAQEQLARKNGAPKLGVGIDYVIVGESAYIDSPDNGRNAFMPMATMTLPLFRGKYKAAVTEAQLNQTALKASKQNYTNNLQSTYELATYELLKATELMSLYNKQGIKSEQMINLLIKNYSTSGENFVEVLRMQQELLKYQVAEATATKNFYIALANLDYITSKNYTLINTIED